MTKTQKRRVTVIFLLAAAAATLTASLFLPRQGEGTGLALPASAMEAPAPVRLMPVAAVPEAVIESGPKASAEPPEVPEEVPEKEKPAGELSATEIMANARLVAHGMGSIDGLATLNCLEGFQQQYEAGVRVFEVDLRLTRDVRTILRHDWWHDDWQEGIDWARIPTREKFLSEKILGQYTPLSFRDLLLIMEKYPDICVVTDTKFTDSDVFFIQFDSMLADAHELGLTYLFDRIMIQVYSGNMRTALHNIYPFPHYIYTLYQDESPFQKTREAFREKAAYCAERGIEGITMPDAWWNSDYAAIAEEYGVRVYVHTVNSASSAQKLLDAGVSAVYTDSLLPADIS